MTLYNLGASGPGVIGQGLIPELAAALGNYSCMMWNFAYLR